jgi:hypothetical protein
MLVMGRSEQLPLLGSISPTFFVYVLAAVTMAVMIAYPEYAQKPIHGPLFAMLGVYGLIKTAQNTGQVIDTSLIVLTIVEMAVLTVTLFAARKLSVTLAHTESSIRDSLLPWSSFTVLDEEDGAKAITEEILRARRYERPLTLIHIAVPRLRKKRFTRWSHRKLLEHEYANLRIIQIIRNVVYDSDIIARHNDDLVVCLPETSPEEAGVLAFPLEALLKTALRDGAKVSMAHFPGDALVYKDLLRAALAAPPVLAPSLDGETLVLEPERTFVRTIPIGDEDTPNELVPARRSA